MITKKYYVDFSSETLLGNFIIPKFEIITDRPFLKVFIGLIPNEKNINKTISDSNFHKLK